MAQVTAALVKQLREMTNSPMMECKKALVKADGDIDRAVDILREMGVAKAVKRAGRATNEGTVATYVSEDGHVAAILELSCETDFVGTNPKFTGFAADLAKVVADNNPADVDALKACAMGQGTVDTELTEMIHIIGENMKIMRFARIEQPEGAIAGYIPPRPRPLPTTPSRLSRTTSRCRSSPLTPSPPPSRTSPPTCSSTRRPSTPCRLPSPASPNSSSRRWSRAA